MADIVSRAQNFDVEIIKYRDGRARGISSNIFAACRRCRCDADRDARETRRIFPGPCRATTDGSTYARMRAREVLTRGRLVPRFFRELHKLALTFLRLAHCPSAMTGPALCAGILPRDEHERIKILHTWKSRSQLMRVFAESAPDVRGILFSGSNPSQVNPRGAGK